jgi:hypothetical protein
MIDSERSLRQQTVASLLAVVTLAISPFGAYAQEEPTTTSIGFRKEKGERRLNQ